MDIAKRSDWKNYDMPEKNEIFTLNRTFDEKQLEVLRRGNIPKEMEDKWFWYMEEDRLYAHRSWTGYCIYIIEFSVDNNHKVTVNRDPEQYKCTSIDEDAQNLNTLLDWWCEDRYDYYNEWMSETMVQFVKSDDMNIMLKSGLNFLITEDKQYQDRFQAEVLAEVLKKGRRIFLDNKLVPFEDFQRNIFYVNLHEKSFFQKRRRFRSVVDTNSELIRALDIKPKVFDMRLQHLWHWSYLCSCAIGLSKGKKYLIFPWIDSTECSIQSYRFAKLYDYSVKHGIAVIIPTNSVEKMEMKGFVYNVLNRQSRAKVNAESDEVDDDMYCKIFVDSSLEFECFFKKICEYIGTSNDNKKVHSLSFDWGEMDVRRNDWYDEKAYSSNATDFVYWRFYIEVYKNVKTEKEVYIEKLRELIAYLRTFCSGTVPASDYEDELNKQ